MSPNHDFAFIVYDNPWSHQASLAEDTHIFYESFTIEYLLLPE